jgi:integrase
MTLLGASKESMKSESEIVYQQFLESLKSEETKRNYVYAVDAFISFLQLKNGREDLSLLIKEQPKDIENAIISYITHLKKEGHAWATINTKLAAVITFFEINDIVLNKRKIHRYMPEHVKTIKDRAYTKDEIQKILANCNLKYKVIVTLMTSTGCHIGALLRISNYET